MTMARNPWVSEGFRDLRRVEGFRVQGIEDSGFRDLCFRDLEH